VKDLRHVVVRSTSLNLQVVATMGPTNPVVSGGYPQWEIVKRPHRVSITNYTGHDPFTMELDLMLFEDIREEASIEGKIRDLERMARANQDFTPPRPPQVRVTGQMIPRPELPWVITDLQWGVTRRHEGGNFHRYLQQVTVMLLQHVHASLVEENNVKPGHGAPKYRLYTIKHGDTLQSIAKKLLGDTSRWKQIAKINHIHDPRHLTVGTKIRVPLR
jgi:LysM repeat protein